MTGPQYEKSQIKSLSGFIEDIQSKCILAKTSKQRMTVSKMRKEKNDIA